MSQDPAVVQVLEICIKFHLLAGTLVIFQVVHFIILYNCSIFCQFIWKLYKYKFLSLGYRFGDVSGFDSRTNFAHLLESLKAILVLQKLIGTIQIFLIFPPTVQFLIQLLRRNNHFKVGFPTFTKYHNCTTITQFFL